MFNKKEIKHFFLPRKDVMSTFVIADKDQNIQGLISYYHLPSSILKSSNYKDLKAAYSYYIVPTEAYDIKKLYFAALIMAKKEGFDVFNALDILDNKLVFDDADFLFKPGDGFLQYYMYNWQLGCGCFQPNEVGKVLV